MSDTSFGSNPSARDWTTRTTEASMSATLKARRHYVCDTLFEGDGPCPTCAARPVSDRRRERILLAAQLRGAARGLGAGWLWLERAATVIEEDGR